MDLLALSPEALRSLFHWAIGGRYREEFVDENNNNNFVCKDEERGLFLPSSYGDGGRAFYQTSDFYYNAVIAVMAVTIVVMWMEFRRLKAKSRSRGRKISDMLTDPSEVRDHLSDTIKEMAEFVVPMKTQRFRKRDRFYFHSRRFVRKMASNVDTLARASRAPGMSRRALTKIARNFLPYDLGPQGGDDSSEGSGGGGGRRNRVIRPAEEYLEEEDAGGWRHEEQWVPEELSYLLNAFHMFGHLDKGIFLELCRSIETLSVLAGQFLFRIGDPDEFIHVVQSGKMDVHILDSDDRPHPIKVVKPGETVSSLLSFIDCLTGHSNPYKSVCCRAITDSVVIRLPVSAFEAVFKKNPEMLIRVVQLIMARLQRVTFVALHQHLGLTSELVRQDSDVSRWDRERRRRRKGREGREDEQQQQQEDDEEDEVSLADKLDQLDSLTSQSSSIAVPLAAVGGAVHHSPGDNLLMELAIRGFQAELDLDNTSILKDRLALRTLSAGDVIMAEDAHNDAGLVFVISGALELSQCNGGSGEEMEGEFYRSERGPAERILYTAYRGECIGQLAMLTGEANFYTCKARETSRVAVLSRDAFFEVVSGAPDMVLGLARSVVAKLSATVRQVDFALDWVHIQSGKALYRQDEPCDGTFIVLSGRLRSVISSGNVDSDNGGSDSGSGSVGNRRLVDEYARGDMVDLVSVATGGTRRPTTVVAARDAELCKVPFQLLGLLKLRYPRVVSRLIALLGRRLLMQGAKLGHHGHHSAPSSSFSPSPVATHQLAQQPNYSTVAVVASSEEVPLTAFCLELAHALTVAGYVTRLSSSVVRQQLGPGAFDNGQDYRLNAWLSHQEHRHKVVIYQCERRFSRGGKGGLTKWNSLCLRQADLVLDLVVASTNAEEEEKQDGEGRTKLHEVTSAEKELEQAAKRTRKELVLLHGEDVACPRNTREWLRRRPWISGHFHMKFPRRLFALERRRRRRRKRRNKVEGDGDGDEDEDDDEQRVVEHHSRAVSGHPPNIHSDFSRLSRYVTGTSVGLVLGGGGARGAAHIGMLKAIQEAGIPVDRLGGVSIGALIGGLWGASRDLTDTTQRAREWFDLLGSPGWTGLMDLTYPRTSLFTGRYFNWTLSSTFGEDLFIEDLWLPFFCCTTDITVSRERVHTKGLFWKYCRASMSYAWLLPPLCDPLDGHLLMDGCYVNNVPGDIMADQNCKFILAVDVAAIEDKDLHNYGDTLSGWWVLWQRMNPFARPLKIPNQSDIQLRLAFCSHYKNLEELKSNSNYEYIKPPCDKYAAGDWKLFDEIREIGYHHGNTLFTGLRKAEQARQHHHQHHHQHHQHYFASQNWSGFGMGATVPPAGTSPPPWFPAWGHQQRQWMRHAGGAGAGAGAAPGSRQEDSIAPLLQWSPRMKKQSVYYGDLAKAAAVAAQGQDGGASSGGARSRAGSAGSRRSRSRNPSGRQSPREQQQRQQLQLQQQLLLQQQQQQQDHHRRHHRRRGPQQQRPTTPNSLAQLRRSAGLAGGLYPAGDGEDDDEEEFLISDESDDTGIML